MVHVGYVPTLYARSSGSIEMEWFSVPLSTQVRSEYQMVTGDKMLGVTCNVLESHPGGAAILLVGFMLQSRDKLSSVGQFGPSVVISVCNLGDEPPS